MRRRGFTLVELMVAIGIVGILAGILLVAMSKAGNSAKRVRAQADLQVIATALEAYKQDFGDYPRPSAGVTSGAQVLCRALVAPGNAAADGADGPGFRIRLGGQGRVYGPYLDPDKFDIDPATTLLYSRVYPPTDSTLANRAPILYYAARPTANAKIDISQPGSFIASGPGALYDSSQNGTSFWVPSGTATAAGVLSQMERMLGNRALDGRIHPATEKPAATGPYLLWIAGPDNQYGLIPMPGDANRYRTDDVTNFDIDTNTIEVK